MFDKRVLVECLNRFFILTLYQFRLASANAVKGLLRRYCLESNTVKLNFGKRLKLNNFLRQIVFRKLDNICSTILKLFENIFLLEVLLVLQVI